MTPPVRGLQKARVAVALVLAGTAAGALFGFAAGVAALLLPTLSPGVALAVVVGSGAADLFHARTGRMPPWSVRRQVPREWSGLFAPATVAVLYGARLGVGPLTILPTWLWWAAMALAASSGPWTGAAAGAVFAITRGAVLLALSEVGRGAMAARMSTVRCWEGAATWVAPAAALVLAAPVVLLLE